MSSANSAAAKKKKGARRPAAGQPSLNTSVITGLIWSAATALALLLIFSVAVYSLDDPGSFVMPASLAALYMSAFCGGLAAALKNRGEPLACGLLCGGAIFIILILLSFIIPGTSSRLGFWTSAGLHALLIPFSLLGAYAGSSLRESGSRRRRHNHR